MHLNGSRHGQLKVSAINQRADYWLVFCKLKVKKLFDSKATYCENVAHKFTDVPLMPQAAVGHTVWPSVVYGVGVSYVYTTC